jgi:hypothetical protein
MSSASPSRRWGGLLAVAAVGLSGALLSVTATAQALPSDLSFATTYGMGGSGTVSVSMGTCAIEWSLVGGRGGIGAQSEVPDWPLRRTVTTTVTEGDVFTLAPGGGGGHAESGGDAEGGSNPQGAGAYDGLDGDPSTGGGGGAATVVLKNGVPYLSVSGGAGAGAGGGAGGTAPAGNASIVSGSDTTAPIASPASGAVTGQGVACENPGATQVPGAPVRVLGASGGPGELYVYFDPSPTPADTAPASGWEYSLDGGAGPGSRPPPATSPPGRSSWRA